MSAFTEGCRDQAHAAWGAAASWPDRYAAWKSGPSVGGRAQRGCLGVLIFGLIYVFVPLLIFFAVETALLLYAALMSALWGAGTLVDSIASRGARKDA